MSLIEAMHFCQRLSSYDNCREGFLTISKEIKNITSTEMCGDWTGWQKVEKSPCPV